MQEALDRKVEATAATEKLLQQLRRAEQKKALDFVEANAALARAQQAKAKGKSEQGDVGTVIGATASVEAMQEALDRTVEDIVATEQLLQVRQAEQKKALDALLEADYALEMAQQAKATGKVTEAGHVPMCSPG